MVVGLDVDLDCILGDSKLGLRAAVSLVGSAFYPNFTGVPMTAPLTLNLVQGSVSFRFNPEAAVALKAELSQLVDRLKTIAVQVNQGGRPEKQETMEYRYSGDVFLEVFCNPNIYPSPFAAKVLLTVRDDRIRLTTEAELPQLIDDLNTFLT